MKMSSKQKKAMTGAVHDRNLDEMYDTECLFNVGYTCNQMFSFATH